MTKRSFFIVIIATFLSLLTTAGSALAWWWNGSQWIWDGSNTYAYSTTSPPPPPAQNCTYGSTQARVQLNTSDPWKQSITVNPGEQFNVGGFHDGTGQFANDITIWVSGPGMSRTAGNGETITNLQPGATYAVAVTTNGQTGGGCEETASVYVNANQPATTYVPYAPAPTPIPYYSSAKTTYAVVRTDTSHNWTQDLTVTCNQVFVVGIQSNNQSWQTNARIQVWHINNGSPVYLTTVDSNQQIYLADPGLYEFRVFGIATNDGSFGKAYVTAVSTTSSTSTPTQYSTGNTGNKNNYCQTNCASSQTYSYSKKSYSSSKASQTYTPDYTAYYNNSFKHCPGISNWESKNLYYDKPCPAPNTPLVF